MYIAIKCYEIMYWKKNTNITMIRKWINECFLIQKQNNQHYFVLNIVIINFNNNNLFHSCFFIIILCSPSVYIQWQLIEGIWIEIKLCSDLQFLLMLIGSSIHLPDKLIHDLHFSIASNCSTIVLCVYALFKNLI